MIEQPAILNLHVRILDIMNLLGYQQNKAGVCFGFSIMAIQAMLANDMKAFEDRINYISTISDRKIRHFQKKYKKDKQKKLLSKNDLKMLDLLSFFDGVAIHHDSSKYPDIFERKKSFKSQNAEETFPFSMSKTLEEVGGVEKLADFSGYYTKDSLVKYFSQLKQLIPEKTTISLALGNINHAISIGYDGENWMFFDINHLPPKFVQSEIELAEMLMVSFWGGNTVVFNTEVYLSKKHCNDKVIINVADWEDSLRKDLKKEVSHLYDLDSQGSQWIALSIFHDKKEDVLEMIDFLKSDYSVEINKMLYYALFYERRDLISSILEKNKFDPNFKVEEDSVFDMAIILGHHDVVDHFISNGDISVEMVRLGVKKAIEHDQVAILKLFFENNDNLIEAVYDGKNLAHLAADAGASECLSYLLEQNKNFLNSKSTHPDDSPSGDTPLILATFLGSIKPIEVLLSNSDCAVNEPNDQGLTALHCAAMSGNQAIFYKLLEQPGIDINIQDMNGETPLMIAASRGNLEAVKALLSKKNINLELKNSEGKSAAELANENDYQDIAVRIIKKKDKIEEKKQKRRRKSPPSDVEHNESHSKRKKALMRQYKLHTDENVNSVQDSSSFRESHSILVKDNPKKPSNK